MPLSVRTLALAALFLFSPLFCRAASGQSLVNGGSVAGSIAPLDDEDTWTFSASVGEGFQVRMTDVAVGSLFPRMRLFDPSGTLISTSSSPTVVSISATAAVSGTYSVVVDDVSSVGSTGGYTIDFVRAPGADELGALPSGGMVSGTIDLGDIDSYTFTIEAGQNYEVRVADAGVTDLFPQLTLYGPSGSVVKSGSSPTVVSLSGAAPVTGTYTLVLTDVSSGLDAAGAYDLHFVRLPDADELGALPNGDSVSGVIGLGDIDSYTVALFSGESYQLRLVDSAVSDFYPQMRFYDPFGQLVASPSSPTVVNLAGKAAYTGTYTVVVTDVSSGLDAAGNYDLHYARVPGVNEGGPLLNGGALFGTLDLGDIDSFTFSIVAGQNFRIRLVDLAVSDLFPNMTLFDPDGKQVAQDSGATVADINAVATKSGTYTLLVTDVSSGLDATGDYAVHFVRTPDADELGSLANGDVVTNSLSLGDIDSFSFQLVGGESFQIRLVDPAQGGLFPLATIYDPFGDYVGQASAATVAAFNSVAQYSGTYTLVVTDISSGLDASGAYQVQYARMPGANEGGSLIDGVVVNDNIALGDLDSYTFNAVAGESSTITVTDTTTSDLFPIVYLYGPLGQFITSASNANVASLAFTVAQDGLHTIVVADTSSGLDASAPYSIVIDGSGAPPVLVPNTLLAPQFPTDPVLADIGGSAGFGPRIGDPTEPFNFSLDCSGADSPSIWLMQALSSGLSTPLPTEFGFLYIAGAPVLTTAGIHAQTVIEWFPTPAGLAIPNDPVLVGLDYTVQGWVGGFGASGRLSNAISQAIGG
ncbi:hypothetical protein [Engelhardtia mirabilis]|uniref:Peptidase C-terminal archaeal/bacterial domain-containing protein n=1 Tax=Engelhardtia mirabilis TaxID=2528011 RepID=A0A518BQR7_9BACT|nr:hypothetical protein Pla133_44400 [Planctomycetes bacterium Pla133]QDV03647.1 hypothetical protein Pla86_44380 [Planctomycetes bacterium Pla86]